MSYTIDCPHMEGRPHQNCPGCGWGLFCNGEILHSLQLEADDVGYIITGDINTTCGCELDPVERLAVTTVLIDCLTELHEEIL
jgi:hypothetical protein